MSVDSRKIEKLEIVDLVVLGYDWTCPHCGCFNRESVESIIVKCVVCGDRFRVNQIYKE